MYTALPHVSSRIAEIMNAHLSYDNINEIQVSIYATIVRI